MYSLPSLGVHPATLQLLLYPSRDVSLLLSSPLQELWSQEAAQLGGWCTLVPEDGGELLGPVEA